MENIKYYVIKRKFNWFRVLFSCNFDYYLFCLTKKNSSFEPLFVSQLVFAKRFKTEVEALNFLDSYLDKNEYELIGVVE